MEASAGRWPVIGKFSSWLQNWARARSSLSELDRTGRGETARVAHDLGMSAAELVNLSRHGPASADLLQGRLQAQHIEAGQISRDQPEVMRDMSRLCSQCRSHGRCARDLARDPGDPAWREYCPNAGTIDALR